jgi:2-methylcitrate dehydratase PrpD
MSEKRRITMELAEWAGSTTFKDLSPEVVHQSKRVILDYLAATLVGSQADSARIVQEYLATIDTSDAATVYGTDLRLSAPNAALANGTATHGLEIDDGYTPGAYHPGGPNISAILAAAETHGSSPEDILLATAIGFELSCRLAGAGHPQTWANGFHNTPLAGVFGAAAGVAKLLGADAMQVANALGLAGSHAGGLFEFLGQGAEVKRLHAGKAARDGLVCAELAVRGLTGPTTVFEGERGYIHAFVREGFKMDFMMDDLGSDWHMLRTYVKPYPCCRHLHGPIDAILAMQAEEPIDAKDITSVEVETYLAASRHGLPNFGDFLDAQMSIPYAVAVTAIGGVPGLEQFGAEWRNDPEVARIAGTVTVALAKDCDDDYPKMRPARVRIHTGSGSRELRIDQPYGEPSNPVSDSDLDAKLLRLAGPVVGDDRCKRIIEETWSFDQPSELFSVLSGAGA